VVVVAYALVAALAVLSAWHVYWLAGGEVGLRTAIPEIDGVQAFQPSAWATVAVAFALALSALLIAATAGIVQLGISRALLMWGTRALALVFVLRALGDFRLVGFFKRIRGTRFADLDTWVYSPFCVLLAFAAFAVSQ
jgi:hypothetical protein